jgi:hypothetical protein
VYHVSTLTIVPACAGGDAPNPYEVGINAVAMRTNPKYAGCEGYTWEKWFVDATAAWEAQDIEALRGTVARAVGKFLPLACSVRTCGGAVVLKSADERGFMRRGTGGWRQRRQPTRFRGFLLDLESGRSLYGVCGMWPSRHRVSETVSQHVR